MINANLKKAWRVLGVLWSANNSRDRAYNCLRE
jgi:hypothetical protein